MASDLEDWLTIHQEDIEVFTGWALVIGLVVLILVELIAFVILWQQEDATMVGRSLKWKKVGYATIFSSLCWIYTTGLLVYYEKATVSFWESQGLMLLLMIGIIASVGTGVWFIFALLHENFRGPR